MSASFPFPVCMCRTMWRVLCAMSASLGSSISQRPTPRAVYAVSVWASPSSALAPLGVEIRQVSKLLIKGEGWTCQIFRFDSVCVRSCCVKPFQALYDEEKRAYGDV